MAHQSKKHSIDKKWIFILGVIIFVIIGISAFVLAYGLSDGWAVVAAWFSSKYAILLYMFIGIFAVVTIIILAWERYKKL